MKKRHEQKLVLLSVALLLLFSAPLLLLFNSADKIFGLPMVYIYLFGVWLFSIIFSLVVIKKYDE